MLEETAFYQPNAFNKKKKTGSVGLLEGFAVHYLRIASCKLSSRHESKLQAIIFNNGIKCIRLFKKA